MTFIAPRDGMFEEIDLSALQNVGDAKACQNWLQQTRNRFFANLSDANLATPVDWTEINEIKGDIARISIVLSEVALIRTRLYNKQQTEQALRNRERQLEAEEANRLAKEEKAARHAALLANQSLSFSFLLKDREIIDQDRYEKTIHRDLRYEEFDERTVWLTGQNIPFTLEKPLSCLPTFGVASSYANLNPGTPCSSRTMTNLWVKIAGKSNAALFKTFWGDDILEQVTMKGDGTWIARRNGDGQ